MLPILYWNITGLKSKFFGLTHSAHEFKSYIKNFKIITLVETWANKKDTFDLPNYQCFSATREKKEKGRGSGGIITYVREELAVITNRLNSSSSNLLWIWIETTTFGLSYNILFGTVYISPENSSIHSEEDTFSILERETLEFRERLHNTKIIIAGDFNGYTSTEPDYISYTDKIHDYFYIDDYSQKLPVRANKDPRKTNKYGRKTLDLCIETGLCILNGRIGRDVGIGEFTCYFGEHPSVIDYFLSDYDLMENFCDFYVDCRNESHHMPLCLSIKLPNSNEEILHESERMFLPKYVWQEDKASDFLQKFTCNDLNVISEKLHRNDIDDAVNTMLKFMTESAEEMKRNRVININKTANHHEPWLDLEYMNLKRSTIKALKEFRKCRCMRFLNIFKDMQSNLNKLYAHKKQIYQEYEKTKVLNMLDSNDVKAFWTSVNKYSRKNQFTNAKISNENWLCHFRSLFNPAVDHAFQWRLIQNYYVYDGILDVVITDTEICQAVGRLKLGKSPGEDGVPAEYYKAIYPLTHGIIKDLFNRIYDRSYFPTSWSNSLVLPIHKKGSHSDPNNYRGVSLLSVFSKMFMNVLYSRINKWCNLNDVLCREQGGFKAGFSTMDSVFTLNTIINKHINKKGGRFYCAFVDFTKAFDLLNREAIWFKLQKLKMSSKMINMLMAVYSNVNARVFTGSGCTDYFECPWGVKQGCIISPTLFNLYINDLPAYFKEKATYLIPLKDHEVSLLLYADDLVLLSDSAIGLQRQLNILQEYCKMWNLKVSEEKSKIMVFRNGGKLRSYEKWYYNNKLLETCTYFCYLGVHFSSVLSWSQNIKLRATKGLRALGCVQSLMYKIPKMDTRVLWKVFDTKIKPILHYGAEIWGFSDAVEIEKVQNNLCKKVLKINSRVPNIALQGETGRLPLRIDRLILIINYWLRIIKLNDNRLTKDAYKLQVKWMEQNKRCWLSDVMTILCNHGFSDVWFNHGVGDETMFNFMFKQRVTDMALQKWNTDLNEMNRLKIYRMYKENCSSEEYIEKLGSFKKCLVANFRCTGLPLKAIVGVYYDKIEYELCFCDFCESPLIENEYHFLLECTAYKEIRRKLIPFFYWNPPSIHKFKQLMTRTDIKWLNNFGNYVQEAMEKRQKLLNLGTLDI